MQINATFPEKLEPLFQPRRYKILYGGRGGAKSWGIARALLIIGLERPLRILCARELQKSTKDSVHRLLKDQISELNLDKFYEVQLSTIRGVNGTEFFFEGLRHNATQIKSYEGADIVWVEEAATVSKSSWEILIPTIRKAGSEIWISFNPELEEDETYQRFVLNPPPDALIIKMNWQDNPWFPDVLKTEMEMLKARDTDAYNTIWGGHCRQALEGAVYARELRQAVEENRITTIPIDPTIRIDTFWDLGYADKTAIWFVQKVGLTYRLVDYYENSFVNLDHYFKMLQDKGYLYGTMYLPHDAKPKKLGMSKTIYEQFISLNYTVKIVPQRSIADGIAVSRAIFNACWFDEKKCADGIQALRRYRYGVDAETGKVTKDPLHDENSHAADAFRYFATGWKDPVPDIETQRWINASSSSAGWMAS